MTLNVFDNYRFSKDTRLRYNGKLYWIREIDFAKRAFKFAYSDIKYWVFYHQVEVVENTDE